MYHIEFKYKDSWSRGAWQQQECFVSSVQQCIDIYGLGIDCDYKILRVETEEEYYERMAREREKQM
jgi:hypothetical protein